MILKHGICVALSCLLLLILVTTEPSNTGKWTVSITPVRFAFVDLCLTAVFAIVTALVPQRIPMHSRWTLFSWVWTFLVFRQPFLSIVLPRLVRLDVAVACLVGWHVLLGIQLHALVVLLLDDPVHSTRRDPRAIREILGNRFSLSAESRRLFQSTACTICLQAISPPPSGQRIRCSAGSRVRLSIGNRVQGVVEILETPCGHYFHYSCVYTWVLWSPKYLTPCPNCAHPLTRTTLPIAC